MLQVGDKLPNRFNISGSLQPIWVRSYDKLLIRVQHNDSDYIRTATTIPYDGTFRVRVECFTDVYARFLINNSIIINKPIMTYDDILELKKGDVLVVEGYGSGSVIRHCGIDVFE